MRSLRRDKLSQHQLALRLLCEDTGSGANSVMSPVYTWSRIILAFIIQCLYPNFVGEGSENQSIVPNLSISMWWDWKAQWGLTAVGPASRIHCPLEGQRPLFHLLCAECQQGQPNGQLFTKLFPLVQDSSLRMVPSLLFLERKIKILFEQPCQEIWVSGKVTNRMPTAIKLSYTCNSVWHKMSIPNA